MILLMAIRSLKDDLLRSVFYWLTFVLTSMFMFLFFHLSYSDMVGVTFINSHNDLATFLTIIVIGICMIVIFFANDFYVKKKSKDLAVRLVCGGTFFQIVRYLLYQTCLLFFMAIPIGITVGYLLFPLINWVLFNYLNSQQILTVQLSAIFSTILIIGCEIFWCVLLNLGYAFRHSIKSLLDNQKSTVKFSFPILFHIQLKTKRTISFLLFFCPIVLIFFNQTRPESFLPFCIVGCFGIYSSIRYILIPYMNHLMINRFIENKMRMIYIGFLRSDIILMKNNIVLMLVSVVLVISLFASSVNNPMEIMLTNVSFIVINVLVSLSVMFRFSTEIVGRKKIFTSIERIGYMEKDQKRIILREVIGLYCFLMGVSLFYIAPILMIVSLQKVIPMIMIIELSLGFFIPMIICAIFNIFYYRKFIMKGVNV